MKPVWARAVAVAALGLLPVTMIAQTKVSGTIDGVVRDSALRPLDNASAWILGTGVELTTRPNGRFLITDIPPGEYIVVVRKIGFAPFSTVIQVPARDTVRPSFELAKADVSLDTIRVTAVAPKFSPMLQEFEDRRKAGRGQFITEDQIHKLNFAELGDYLRTLHSVHVNDSGVVVSARFPMCPLQWFVDGVLLPNSANPNLEMPKVNEIYGIEVYETIGTIPVQYATMGVGNGNALRGGSFCGVVLLWTKRGD